MSRACRAVLPFILLLIVGCDSESPPSTLPTTQITLGQASFVIEIANTPQTREKGLMQRDSMPANHGMIFVFPDETPRSFWMKNTRFPLDIAFLDHNGEVVSIKQMKAYDLTPVPSDAPAKYAIELNLNAAAQAGVKVGDHVNIPPEARATKD